MAIFGKKNNDNDSEKGLEQDLDSLIMSAIEETDAEEAALKEEKRLAHEENLRRQREEAEAARKAQIDAQAGNGGRRCYLISESSEIGTDSIKVTGDLHGEMHVGDKVYVYRPGGTVVMTEVLEITRADEEKNEGAADGAKNARIGVSLKFKFKNVGIDPEKLIPKYCVISSVKPAANPKAAVENPAVLGLSMKYKDCSEDKEYMKILSSHITNGRYLVPAHEDGIGPDGKRKLKIVAFNRSTGANASQLEGEEDVRMMPLFTDLGALSAWKALFADGKKPAVVVMSFPEAVAASVKNSMDLVFNAFGPVPVRFPREIVENISKSKIFIERFGEDGKKKPSYRKETITSANKIMVGEPPETAETKAIRGALKDYAATIDSISSLGLLAKKNAGEDPGYLVIVDCPKGTEREIFRDMYDVMKPFLNKIRKVEFSLYEQTVFADDYFAIHTLDYVRNPNI